MRRILIVVAAAAAIAAALWTLLLFPAVENRLFRAIAFREMARPRPVLAGKNEMSVLLCGTGSPLPDKSRGGPCTMVAVEDKLYLVDTGLDTARDLMLWRVPLENIAGILITHFHSDHIADLGEVRLQTWVAGRKAPLPVYGPPGVERVVAGFNEAYALDDGYRTAHHGAQMLPPDAVALAAHPTMPGTVLDKDGLKITAIVVHHPPATPAYGYRFDFAGRSVVISGDTAPDENLARAAKGADILVHEGLSPEMVAILRDATAAAGRPRQSKIFHDIPGYHSSPVDAAGIANEAGVKLLVFSHIIPMLPNRFAERLFLHGVADVRPDGVRLGHDGETFRLPGHSTAIEESDLN
jgi:ribonuclease Z